MDSEYTIEPVNKAIHFGPEVVEELRKEFNIYNKTDREEAINIINEWIKNQNHFTKKDFSKGYIERTIISSKGSLERAKKQIDKICTMRTLMPKYFEITNIKNNEYSEIFKVGCFGIMPNLTKEHNRVIIVRMHTDAVVKPSHHTMFLHLLLIFVAYLKATDYCRRYTIVFDYFDANLAESMTNMNLYEYQKCVSILTEGYGFRIKNIIMITASKLIDNFIKMMKPFLSQKMGDRFRVVSSREGLQDVIIDDVLPKEYGGPEKTLQQLNDEMIEIISSESVQKLIKEMYEATTDESKRQIDKFNDQYMGMPGTFRTLSLD